MKVTIDTAKLTTDEYDWREVEITPIADRYNAQKLSGGEQ